METIDSLRRNDKVTVAIFGPDGSQLYQSTSGGHRSLEGAVGETLSKADLGINPEDCVFEVDNLQTGVSHRYRLNAHGHLKLIV